MIDVDRCPILTLVTFLPLVGAIVVAIAAGAAGPRPTALAFALATWVVSLLLLVGYLPRGSRFQYVEPCRLDPASSASSTSSGSTACRSRSSS